MKVVLLGAPGAGKGSQAVKIVEELKIPHISTGDALRANIVKNTDLGIFAKTFIDQGLLVPDEVVVSIVADRISHSDCEKGFLLDGFPRNINQAEELDKLTDLDIVINIDVDFAIIHNRISGRRMCSCGESYHISTYKGEFCAKCGEKLYQRADDNEETVTNRLQVYEKQTSPLIKFYEEKGILANVDGNDSIDKVFSRIKAILNGSNH